MSAPGPASHAVFQVSSYWTQPYSLEGTSMEVDLDIDCPHHSDVILAEPKVRYNVFPLEKCLEGVPKKTMKVRELSRPKPRCINGRLCMRRLAHCGQINYGVEMPREDGRVWKRHRKIDINWTMDAGAKSTATVAMGNTVVKASLYGLSTIPHRRQNRRIINFRVFFAEKLICKTDQCLAKAIRDRDLIKDCLSESFEPVLIRGKMKRVEMNAVVTVLGIDGSLPSVCVTAVALAFERCRVPMIDVVAPATVAVLPDGSAVVDPTYNEEMSALSSGAEYSHGILNITYLPCTEMVVNCVMTGRLYSDTVEALCPFMKEYCDKLNLRMRTVMKRETMDELLPKTQPLTSEELTAAWLEKNSQHMNLDYRKAVIALSKLKCKIQLLPSTEK